jgi:dTDP-6-deoxy-L-talose 4-dehydrogenase (NAD+)
MKIFITGGTGFIGQAVVCRLKRAGHQLLVLTKRRGDAKQLFGSSKNIKLAHGSLIGLKALEPAIRRFRPTLTIHLAWEGIPDYGAIMSARNLIYGVNLMEMIGRLGCPVFVGAGSCWEYGATVGKISEKTPPKPSNPFTAAKLSSQLFGEQIAAEYGIKFIWARFFYVYGPGQKMISLIPSLIKSAKQGKAPELKNPNGGNDFIYVDDVAEAIARIAQKRAVLPTGIYNIGSGRLTSVRRIVDLVFKYFGAATRLPSTKQRPVGFYADISKLNKATGWRPCTSLEQGIKQTIKYFQETV